MNDTAKEGHEDRFWTGELKEIIRGYALQNAVKFNGKANPKALIGKLMGENPEMRSRKNDVLDIINGIAEEVNKLSFDEQVKELEAKHPELLEEKPKKDEKKELPKLKDVGKPIVMRFAPSPSGPLHIGHAYVLGLNSALAKENKAKLILRIEDTNPTNIDPEAYKMIPENANWLTENGISEVIVQSERMELYLEKALDMINAGHAYVCTCTGDEFREISKRKEECPCRNKSTDTNLKNWHKMGSEFKEGEAVLRFKTDMQHKNPAMRDFPLFRICEEEHPRKGKKYRMWPLMNFSVTIDDNDLGVTHILRAKDHADNALRQEYMYHAMKWDVPQTLFVGRINFTELNLSTSETRSAIEEGKYDGWDDPRLPFLMALRRRGYQPGAFIRYALEVGVSLNDKKSSNKDFFKFIDTANTEIIEAASYRYFLINDPIEITIAQAPAQKIELDLHPDNKKGGRKFNTSEKFLITKEDYDHLRDGKLNRLMDCLNFIKQGDSFSFDSIEYEKYKDKGDKIIHWLPAEDSTETIEVSVLMPDGSTVSGRGEAGLKKLDIDAIIQFERFGFCRLDKKEGYTLVFCYGHR